MNSVPATQTSRPQFASLTSLRAVAASGVFLVHSGFTLTATSAGPLFNRLSPAGSPGVTLFFVLSGYLLGRPVSFRGGTGAFYRRRIGRILPTYLAVLLLGILLLTLEARHRHSPSSQLSALNVVLNALLLQSWSWKGIQASIIVPAWSLSIEVLFYLLLPLAIAWFSSISRARPRLVLWVMAMACAAAALLMTLRLIPVTFPPSYLAVFAFGSFLVVTNPRPLSVWLASVLSITGIGAFVLIVHYLRDFPAYATTAIPLGLLVHACAQRDQVAGEAPSEARSVLRSAALVRFGLWSYSFFLIHTLVIFVTDALVSHPPHSLAVGLGLMLTNFLVAWAAAALMYGFLEEPIRIRLSRSPSR